MYRFLGRCPGFPSGSHTPNRLLGHRDGAQGFRADYPKPRNDSGQRLPAPLQTTSSVFGVQPFIVCESRSNSSPMIPCSVWLQELNKSACWLLSSNAVHTILLCPLIWLQELLRNPRMASVSARQDLGHFEDPACRRHLLEISLRRLPRPARSRTRREGTQRALPPYTSCVPAMLHSQLVIPKPPIQIVRGSTLVLSQEPRPKQGMAARHP